MAKDRAVHTDRPPVRVTSVAMSGPNPGQWRFLLDLARCALASVYGSGLFLGMAASVSPGGYIVRDIF